MYQWTRHPLQFYTYPRLSIEGHCTDEHSQEEKPRAHHDKRASCAGAKANPFGDVIITCQVQTERSCATMPFKYIQILFDYLYLLLSIYHFRGKNRKYLRIFTGTCASATRKLAKSSSSSLHCDIHCNSSLFIVAKGISARVS